MWDSRFAANTDGDGFVSRACTGGDLAPGRRYERRSVEGPSRPNR